LILTGYSQLLCNAIDAKEAIRYIKMFYLDEMNAKHAGKGIK
jgi:hypothetical protein